jgi:DNA-binding transcriptional ArsR family regulator
MEQSYSTIEQPQGAFRALADPTRRSILLRLCKEDLTIGEIVDHFDVTRGAIKKHLVVLEEGGLISVRQRGRERVNSLEPMGLKTVDDWMQHFHQFWEAKLGNLKEIVEKSDHNKYKRTSQ